MHSLLQAMLCGFVYLISCRVTDLLQSMCE